MKVLPIDVKVTFYLKRNVSLGGLCPVMGRITIGKDMVQFSCKLDADPSLWDVRAGRINGKSHHARVVNREIDKINVAINARYKDIVALNGRATAIEVKNAFQGITSGQDTLLKLFDEHNREYAKMVGVSKTPGTIANYRTAYAHAERFISDKYHVRDIPFKQLDCSFTKITMPTIVLNAG